MLEPMTTDLPKLLWNQFGGALQMLEKRHRLLSGGGLGH